MTESMPPLSFEDAPDFIKPQPSSDDSIAGRVRKSIFRPEQEAAREKRERARTIEPPSRPGEFVQPVGDFYRFVGLTLMPFDTQCASVILMTDENKEILRFDGVSVENPNYGKDRAQLCAEALDEAAQKSPQLRRVLRMMTTGGTWGKVIAAHAPIVWAVVAHHTSISASIYRRMGATDVA